MGGPVSDGRHTGESNGHGNGGREERPVRPETVRAELARVLESHEFRSSKRCQDFLRYVVEHTLDGHSSILKERTIGIEAFGRPASYDPSDDATVRVKAGEVRKRLNLYYTGEGKANELKIELPPGGSVPDFVWSPAAGENAPTALDTALSGRRPRRRWAWSLLAAAVAAACISGWLELRRPHTPLEQFWEPVLQGDSPALLCAAYVPVYADRVPNRDNPKELGDFVLLNDQFVGGGDLMAASRLSALFTRMNRAYQVRIGTEVTFQDLRAAPAVLIGYSYTRWREISQDLRFFIDASRRPVVITDYGKPTKWSLPNLSAGRHTAEDYAIVSRVFHPDTRAMMVEVSGITQYGTEAAADLITNADMLAYALRSAPSGWQRKNLQLVLHVKVISGSPATPNVIASYFW